MSNDNSNIAFHDSGERKNFESGSQRDRVNGKGKFCFISPIGLKRLALRYEVGHIKYGDARNWEKGMPISEFIDSAKRHINDYELGLDSEDHLAAAAWNLFSAMHIEEVLPKFQDIPMRMRRKRRKWSCQK